MIETKTALLFPGQGLQPREIINYYQKLKTLDQNLVRNRLALAQAAIDKIHGTVSFNLAADLEDETAPSFTMTAFVQPVVYTLSILASEIVAKGSTRLTPQFVAGHSLGEYSALTQAGVFPFEKGVEIVAFRGQVMQDVCDKTPSRLVSINGLSEDEVEKLCQQSYTQIALINAPTLIVVGCAKDHTDSIEALAKELGAKRTTVLPTAGAFHASSFMQEAASKLDEFLIREKYDFTDANIPVIQNLTGHPLTSSYALKNGLYESMLNPVKWAQSIQTMREAGVENFVEVGPGKSLSSLNRLNEVAEAQTVNILDLAA